MASSSRVAIVRDNVGPVFAALRELLNKQVLVGIPEDKTTRSDDDAITNASIAYIHEFGSPAANIPARPFLIPGVQKAQAAAVNQLKKAATYALNGEAGKSDGAMKSAGVVGSESVRNEIINGNFAPLSPRTIAARASHRGDSTRRQSETDYLRFVASGVEPGAAQAEVGIKPLINTGEMLRSITFVVRTIK